MEYSLGYGVLDMGYGIWDMRDFGNWKLEMGNWRWGKAKIAGCCHGHVIVYESKHMYSREYLLCR